MTSAACSCVPRVAVSVTFPNSSPKLSDIRGVFSGLPASRDAIWSPSILVEVKKDKIRSWKGEFYLDQKYTYGVFEKANDSLIGMIFLFTRQGKGTLEIGYVVDKDEEGKGYATESSYAVMKLGLENLGIGKMVIHCSPENTASQRVPEKLGFTLEGTYRSAHTGTDGKRQPTMIWALFNEEFKLSPKFEPVDFEIEPGWN